MLFQNTDLSITIKMIAIISAFLVGCILFAYVNHMIYVLPLGIDDEDEGASINKTGLLIKNWNKCPFCQEKLGIIDLIPVLGYFGNGRNYPCCNKKKSIRRPIIELLGGLLGVIVILYYGITMATVTVFLLYALLTAIAVIDMDTQYIPPELNVAIFILGLISIWSMPGTTILERIIGAACVSIPLIIIVCIIPEGFGGGDIKLMIAAGFFLGWKATLTAFFIGLILGGVFGVYLLIMKKKGKGYHFAFGPFLGIGIAIATYAGCGTYLMNLYIEMIKISLR